jgi:hypothetical protein
MPRERCGTLNFHGTAQNKTPEVENSKNLKIGFFILFQTKGPQKRLKNCEIFQRTAKTEPDGPEQ